MGMGTGTRPYALLGIGKDTGKGTLQVMKQIQVQVQTKVMIEVFIIYEQFIYIAIVLYSINF